MGPWSSEEELGPHSLWHLGFHPKLKTPQGWLLGFLLSHREVTLSLKSKGRGIRNIVTHTRFSAQIEICKSYLAVFLKR